MSPRRRYRLSSLRARVALATTSLLTVVLVVAALALAGWTQRSLTQDARADLTDQVDEIRLLTREGQLTPVLSAAGTHTGQVQVLDSNDKVIAASPGLATRGQFDVIPTPVGDATSEATVDGSRLGRRVGDPYLVVARNATAPSGSVVVYGVSSLRAADRAVHALTVSLLGGIPVIVALAGLLLWRAVGRALRPVETMRAEVEDIGATSLERRVTPPASDDEVGRLADTLNGLLDRLDAAARRERRFAADASHELRSPLAAARTQLEVGLAYPGATDWAETARDVLVEIERLERLSGDLLRMAKHDAGAGRRDAPLDLATLVDEQLRSQAASTVLVEIEVPTEALPVRGDHELLVRVVRNLFSNANRHAESRIVISSERVGHDAVLHIANDGPSIPADQREHIFEPFARLDDARTGDEGGAGLGLSIARHIAEDHGGTLECNTVPSGAMFTLRLPLADRADAARQLVP